MRRIQGLIFYIGLILTFGGALWLPEGQGLAFLVTMAGVVMLIYGFRWARSYTNQFETCPSCEGTGTRGICPDCQGKGIVKKEKEIEKV